MTMLQTLLDMGFSKIKAEKAVDACGENLDNAMEWLLAHQDDPDLNEESSQIESPSTKNTANASVEENPANGGVSTETSADTDTTARSLKCDECQKLFNNSDEVEYHALKSGHSSFSESTEVKKPLTEEEKKEKLKQLEEKLKQRRIEKSEQARKEALEKEKKRIQTGKDIAEAKRKHEEMEIKKLAEERRRERLEDKLARQRVLEQIQRDRQARKERDNMGTTGQTYSSTAGDAQTSQSMKTETPKKTHDSTRLQFRFMSGPPLVQTFKASEPFSAVYLYANMNRPGGCDGPNFKLSTTFPRRIFTEEDMEKPLHALDLVPSAVLVLVESK